jgi:hypothetical protein
MTYFQDLSEYTYLGSALRRPGTKNIGWLGLGQEFATAEPTEELLAKLWSLCKISVARTRGFHKCELCLGEPSHRAERNGERLLLGTSEIRAFGMHGEIYAAPTLIYHYVEAHRYKPSDEFLQALSNGPIPPSQEYFDRLAELHLDWRKTSAPAAASMRFSLEQNGDGRD